MPSLANRQWSPELARVMRIAQDPIVYAGRHPTKLREIGRRLSISPEAALALAIADHVCEEFRLTER